MVLQTYKLLQKVTDHDISNQAIHKQDYKTLQKCKLLSDGKSPKSCTQMDHCFVRTESLVLLIRFRTMARIQQLVLCRQGVCVGNYINLVQCQGFGQLYMGLLHLSNCPDAISVLDMWLMLKHLDTFDLIQQN